MANTVIGLFDKREDSERAAKALADRGFGPDRISVVAADREGQTKRGGTPDGNAVTDGTVSGLASGAVVGGLLGILIGAGAIFLPGGILVAGPITALIAGATAGAATGGVLGALIGMGIPKEHANVYAEAVNRGGTLLAVEVDGNQGEEVEQILMSCGAANVEERALQYQQERTHPGMAPVTLEQAEIEQNVSNTGADAGQAASQGFATLGSTDDEPTTAGTTGTTGATAGTLYPSGAQGRGGEVSTDTIDLAPGSMGLTVDPAGTGAATTGEITQSDTSGLPPATVLPGGYAEMEDFTNEFQRDYGDREGPYERFSPAYDFGFRHAQDPRFGGRVWNEIESELRDEWERRQPGTWPMVRDAIRVGWDRCKVRGPKGGRAQLI